MRWIVALALALALAGCSRDGADSGPYFEFVGGGFVFNYRLAEADYGFVVKRLRRVPAGTVLEARFEDPSGGDPLRVIQPVRWGRVEYVFRSPPVHGVVAGREYAVELRVLEPETGRVLASQARTFRADVDQSVLPARPPVVGPGYQRAPPG